MRRLMWGRASISSPVKITKKKLKDPYNLNVNADSDFTNAMDMLTFGADADASSKTTAVKEKLPPAPDPFRELIIMSDKVFKYYRLKH